MDKVATYLHKQFSDENISAEVLSTALMFLWDNIQNLRVTAEPTNVVTSDEGGIHFAWKVAEDWITADIEPDSPSLVEIYCAERHIDVSFDPSKSLLDWDTAKELCRIFTEMGAA